MWVRWLELFYKGPDGQHMLYATDGWRYQVMIDALTCQGKKLMKKIILDNATKERTIKYILIWLSTAYRL